MRASTGAARAMTLAACATALAVGSTVAGATGFGATGFGATGFGAAWLGATPAHAAHPNTVCSHWGPDGVGSHHVQVDWLAGRSFRVSIVDFTLRAATNGTGDAYVPLPLEPALRLSTSVVRTGAGLAVSDVSLSQAVALGPGTGAGGPYGQIDNYLGLPPAPWESATITDEGIEWLHDVDARSDADGVQTHPSDAATNAARAADSAGVLSFTVTVPDAAAGDIELVSGLTTTLTTGVLGVETETWSPGQVQAASVAGCSVTVEAVGQEPEPAEPGGTGEKAPGEANRPGSAAQQRGTPSEQGTAPGAKQHGSADAPALPDRPEARESGRPGSAANDDALNGTAPSDGSRPGAEPRSGSAEVASSGWQHPAAWLIGTAIAAVAGATLISMAARQHRNTRRQRH